MSTNVFARLKALLPAPPLMIVDVLAHNDDGTSTVQLPSSLQSELISDGLQTGTTFRVRGTSVAEGSRAFVRNNVIENEAPSGEVFAQVVGSVEAEPFGPDRLAFVGPLAPPRAVVGAAYSFDTSVGWPNGYPPKTYSLVSGSLPAGLTLVNGVIVGTPTGGAEALNIVSDCTDTTWRNSQSAPFSIGYSDPNFANVVLGLHFDGIDNSTRITDSSLSAKTVTPVGGACIRTTSSRFNGSSLYLDGSGDKLTLAASSDWALGNTYTISFWANPSALPGSGNYCRLIMIGTNNTNTALFLGFDSAGALSAGVPFGGTTTIVSAPGVVTTGVWNRYDLSVSGGVARLFKGGVVVAGPTTITAQSASSGNGLIIGFDTVGTVNFNYFGYVDDLQIVKGVARWTSGFTASGLPFADS